MGTNFKQIQIPMQEQENNGTSADSFGCCSHYRECSDTGKCVISHMDYSANCIYRKSLESGKIFYGKNRSDFSSTAYEEIKQCINSLGGKARHAFDELAVNFCEYNRGQKSLYVRNEFISELTKTGLFIFSRPDRSFLELCSYNFYLKPLFNDAPLYKAACVSRKNELDKLSEAIKEAKHLKDTEKVNNLKKELDSSVKPNTKDFLYGWLDVEARPLMDALTSPYRLAMVNPEKQSYLEEYYRDFLITGFDVRIYTLSPLAEDNVLSSYFFEEEELRRVTLSHGYSSEEKRRRIGNIQEMRFASQRNIFWEKMCVITGTLSIPRTDAFLEILKCGGKFSDTPVNSMDILIMGNQEWSEKNNGIASRKLQKVADLQSQGKKVIILTEDEFYMMIRAAMQYTKKKEQ